MTLLQRVDLAATAAKSVPGSVQLYNPALESRSLRLLGLAGDLRRALDDGELEVYFQPKVTLRDRHLVGVEGLARWDAAVEDLYLRGIYRHQRAPKRRGASVGRQ